jgi:diguanylate cyclase (GGDEF)-like protein
MGGGVLEEAKILIAESDPRIAELAVIKLSNAGYWVISAYDGEEAVKKALDNELDLMLISPNLPQKDGYEVCSEILRDPRKADLPIILLVDEAFDEAQFNQIGLKVELILAKPFSPKNLLGAVNRILTHRRLLKEINPQTMLPGRVFLAEKIDAEIAAGSLFYLIFTDMKNFRTYNKYYGYEQGDKVIAMFAAMLKEELVKSGLEKTELFHFGGDDFAIFTGAPDINQLCQTIIDRFDKTVPGYYLEVDRDRGGLVVQNRQGIVEQWPMMTLALGVATNHHRKFKEWLEAETIAQELVRYAKTMPGSKYAIDRRRT